MYELVHYPDDRLRQTCTIVKDFSEMPEIAERMLESMRIHNGCGLAAPQVGLSQRIFVVQVDQPLVFINPEILSADGKISDMEGCLSIRGFHETVERPAILRARAQDIHGESFTMDADGLLARAIHHENDHLNGVLMIDHLTRQRRKAIDSKLLKR